VDDQPTTLGVEVDIGPGAEEAEPSEAIVPSLS
jgi:hypothetical protein